MADDCRCAYLGDGMVATCARCQERQAFRRLRSAAQELLDAEWPQGVPDGAASHWTDLRDAVAEAARA